MGILGDIVANRIDKIVNDRNVTTSSSAICPDGNLLNIFISEKASKLLLKFGINHVAIKNPIVIIPAIIWFSVKLDANIPNDT